MSAELLETYRFAHAPLTGTLVMAHLLKSHARVAVCGFDNLAGSADALRHYFSTENIIGDWTTYHEPDKEAVFLREMVAAGRIVPL